MGILGLNGSRTVVCMVQEHQVCWSSVALDMIACQSSHVIGYELIKNQIGEPSQPIQAARSSLLLIVLRGLIANNVGKFNL